MTYSPKAGSLPDRVLAFLESNPEEELSRSDVAVKFDANSASVDTLLQLAVARGCLIRARNGDAELVWRLGRVPAQREAPAAESTQSPPSPFPSRISVLVDPDAIKVRKGQRLKTPEERFAERFDALFDKFEIGDSAEFDADWEAALQAQIKRYSRGKKVRFAFLQTEPGKVGMERRK